MTVPATSDEPAGPATIGADQLVAPSWFERNGWIVATLWLMFLSFPLLSVVTDDDLSSVAKVVAIALLAAFAVVYADGFRRLHHAAAANSGVARDSDRPAFTGKGHFAALVAITVALPVVAGPGTLGAMSFVVAFACFNFSWWFAWATLVAGVAVSAAVPAALGAFADLWFFPLIVVAVGGASILIRAVEGSQADRAQLQTRLAISDERTRLARDVHDVLGHSLTAVILKAELCRRLLDQVEPADEAAGERLAACQRQLAELDSVSRAALAEIRSTVGGLRATNLADEVAVARTVLSDAGVRLLVVGEPSAVADEDRAMLAWVVREAVTNVVRHARASQCHIELAPSDDGVLLRISDDGLGIDATASGAAGHGLRGLRERVEAAGAELRVTDDDGTRIEVSR